MSRDISGFEWEPSCASLFIFQVQRGAVEGLEVTRVRRAYSFLVESLNETEPGMWTWAFAHLVSMVLAWGKI